MTTLTKFIILILLLITKIINAQTEIKDALRTNYVIDTIPFLNAFNTLTTNEKNMDSSYGALLK